MNNAQEVRKIIIRLLKKQSNNASKMLIDLGYSQSLLSDMDRRNAMPSADKLATIAGYLGVTTDYLLGLTTNPNSADAINNAYESILIDAYRNKPEMQAAVNKLLDISKESSSSFSEVKGLDIPDDLLDRMVEVKWDLPIKGKGLHLTQEDMDNMVEADLSADSSTEKTKKGRANNLNQAN